MNKSLAFASIVAAVAFTASASANVYFEGFEDAAGNTVFTEPFFNHDFQDPGDATQSGFWDILTGDNVSAPNALWLYPARDVITFNTAPGEFVVDASVHVNGQFGYAEATIFGFDASMTPIDQKLEVPQGTQGWQVLQSNNSFAEITRIELVGFEGVFDNLQVEAVPEPATMLALGAGVAMLAARRRKKNA
jgi:hypothetical protein